MLTSTEEWRRPSRAWSTGKAWFDSFGPLIPTVAEMVSDNGNDDGDDDKDDEKGGTGEDECKVRIASRFGSSVILRKIRLRRNPLDLMVNALILEKCKCDRRSCESTRMSWLGCVGLVDRSVSEVRLD